MSEDFPKIRLAKVISDNDSAGAPSWITPKTGCVKVRVFPETVDVLDSDLPWAMPDDAGPEGTKSGQGKHDPPKVGSYVKVRIEDPQLKQIFYTSGQMFSSVYPYTESVSKISVDGYVKPTYPEPRLLELPDGSVVFWDSTTGDMGIQHKTGAYAFISAAGDVKVKATTTFTFKNTLFSLSSLISELLGDLVAIQTVGPPPQHVLSPTSITAFNALLAKFESFLSE